MAALPWTRRRYALLPPKEEHTPYWTVLLAAHRFQPPLPSELWEFIFKTYYTVPLTELYGPIAAVPFEHTMVVQVTSPGAFQVMVSKQVLYDSDKDGPVMNQKLLPKALAFNPIQIKTQCSATCTTLYHYCRYDVYWYKSDLVCDTTLVNIIEGANSSKFNLLTRDAAGRMFHYRYGLGGPDMGKHSSYKHVATAYGLEWYVLQK